MELELELDQLSRAAQAQLGLVASYLATGNWMSGSNTGQGAVKSWGKYMVPIVLELRDLSRELAIAHYQLVRYLQTGAVLGEPLDGDRSPAGLLSAFLSRVRAVSELADSDGDLGADIRSVTRRGSSDVQLSLDALKDALAAFSGELGRTGDAVVDEYVWPVFNHSGEALDELAAILSDATQHYYRGKHNIRTPVVKSITDQLDQARRDASDKDDLKARQDEIVKNAGHRGAGEADRIVLAAGRDVVDHASHNDKRVKMYARGTSNDPCAFCAMLASRGFVYKEELNGSDAGFLMTVVRTYHPNCHCYPIVRWSEKSELPELNRYFERKWREVTGGHYGQNKLKVWRQWMNKKKDSGTTWGSVAA